MRFFICGKPHMPALANGTNLLFSLFFAARILSYVLSGNRFRIKKRSKPAFCDFSTKFSFFIRLFLFRRVFVPAPLWKNGNRNNLADTIRILSTILASGNSRLVF